MYRDCLKCVNHMTDEVTAKIPYLDLAYEEEKP